MKPTIAFLILLVVACKPDYAKRADKLHEKIVTIDSHTDTPLNLMDSTLDLRVWNDADKTYTRYDYPRMKAGGLDAAFFAVFLGQRERSAEDNTKAIDKAHRIFKVLQHTIQNDSDYVELALKADDALKIKNSGKRAIYIGIENAYVLGDSIELLDEYYNMGARYLTLVHTKNNDLCDSANDTLEHDGLSNFGREVIREMNRMGMMVDVSHASDKAFYDIVKASKTPVIASHSCARAICDNPRNMTDDMLKVLAETGGVIQMCILSDYVKTPPANHKRDSARTELRKKYNNFKGLTDEQNKAAWSEWRQINRKYKTPLATVSDVVDHIDHIVKVAGIDHVGIGTDFDGGGGIDGCKDVSEMKNITIELLKRGYSNTDIEKIWSGNLLRVFREVEAKRG